MYLVNLKFDWLKYKNFNNFALFNKKTSILLSQRHKYKSRRKKSLFQRINHSIIGSYNNFVESFKSKPTKYRPYLGPQSKDISSDKENIDVSEDRNEIVEDSKYSRPVSNKKHHKKSYRLSDIRKRWEAKREKRKKRKFKKKVKQRHIKKHKKRARLEFIRRFFPNYKKPRNIPLVELSDEEAAEVIKQRQKNYFYYTINSIALFIIAYLLVYFMYQLTVLVVASRWKLDSVLMYYDLAFNDYSPLWTRSNIILVTFSGPFISLIIGFLFYRFFSNRRKVKGFLKLFFLWIALHGFNQFLGAWATGVSFDEGFGYVPAWLYMNVFWQILISLIFLFILGIIGYYSASKFLDTSKSAFRVNQENKSKFLLFQAVLPWVIGTLILILVKIPNNMPYDTGNMITLLFGVVPILFNRYARPTVSFEKERKPTKIKWLYIVIFVVLILAFRIGLDKGLHVLLNYKFTMSLEIVPL